MKNLPFLEIDGPAIKQGIIEVTLSDNPFALRISSSETRSRGSTFLCWGAELAPGTADPALKVAFKENLLPRNAEERTKACAAKT